MRAVLSGTMRLGCVAFVAAGCSAAPPGEATSVPDPGGGSVDAESTRATSTALRVPDSCGLRLVAPTGDPAKANTCRSFEHPCATIGQAVAASCPGDVVLVGPGTYVENVVVDRALSIAGAGERTVVVPALSSPNPCSDSSLCNGAASSVFLVRASRVTIAALTIDGDNPALTSGISVGGADVDARNGIITDFSAPFDDLTVVGVTVRNVYLRGLDAASGGTFRFEANRVSNVSSDPQAIAIFNSNGAGTIADNVVTGAAAAIASNFSRGVTFARNKITGAGAGIHTDNAGAAAGSSPDAIVDNVVTACAADGFGAFAFIPSQPVTFRGNRVTGCAVGLATFGEGANVQTRFVANRVDGAGAARPVGIYATTSQLGFGSNDVHVLVEGNRITNAGGGDGVGVLVEQETGFSASAEVRCNVIDDARDVVTASPATNVHDNALPGSNGAALGLDATALGTATLAAPGNWWGCAAGPGTAGCSGVTATVDPNPVASAPPACTFAARL